MVATASGNASLDFIAIIARLVDSSEDILIGIFGQENKNQGPIVFFRKCLDPILPMSALGGDFNWSTQHFNLIAKKMEC